MMCGCACGGWRGGGGGGGRQGRWSLVEGGRRREEGVRGVEEGKAEGEGEGEEGGGGSV